MRRKAVLSCYQFIKYGGMRAAKESKYITISSGASHFSHLEKAILANPIAARVTGSVGKIIFSQLPPS